MKTLRYFLAVILSFALIFALVSCKNTEIKQSEQQDVINEQPKENNDEQVKDEAYETEVTLYFPDNDVMFLYPETRTVEVATDKTLEQTVLEELFKGPFDVNLSPALDGENLVISVVTDEEGICTVDFTSDFVVLNSGGTTRETFAIGSIVNSLCSLENVECVKINIDGNENAVFGGHFTLEAPFYEQTDLIKQ